MRQWIRTHMTFANVVSLLALSVALGGTTYAATGGNFILGQSNSAGSTTALSSGTTFAACARSSPNDQVQMIIISAVDHSSFASTTQAVAGGDKSAADMNATGGFNVAIANPPAGSGNVNSVSGSAIGPDGQEVFFNLYQGINARNQSGQCIFGGSFVVK
jgi:hypothetical protein